MIITLTSDFGIRDGFAAIMKGVIYAIAPNVKAEVEASRNLMAISNPVTWLRL